MHVKRHGERFPVLVNALSWPRVNDESQFVGPLIELVIRIVKALVVFAQEKTLVRLHLMGWQCVVEPSEGVWNRTINNPVCALALKSRKRRSQL